MIKLDNKIRNSEDINVAANDEIINGIKLMREGNQEGFNILYNYTHDYVYKRARFIMKNEDDALDLMQETYTQVYKNISSLENAENIYGWIGGIEYRQGMQIFRSRKEVLATEEAEAIFDDIVSEDMDANPEETAEARATVDIVMSFVEELPELQKAAIIAFYYDNKKIDDIAAEFQCSPNTIKSRLNYAKKFLKDKVESHEKSHGYKLHTVSPVIIIAALKGLFSTKKYAISPEASQALYANVIKASGITSATAASTAAASAAATSTSAVATVAAEAAKVGMGIGAKLAIGAAAVALTAAVTVGVIAIVSDEEETTAPIASTVELLTDEDTDNSAVGENYSEEVTTEDTENTTESMTEEVGAEGWNLLEGQYVCAYGGFDKALVISNVNAPTYDINDVTFDVEYCGMKGENVVINDRTVTFTVYHDNGSVSDVELLIWTDYADNNEYGQLIELKGVTTTTSDGMVADMNNITPVIYSKKMAKETDPVMHWWTIDDGEYVSNTMFEATKPEGYTYSVSIASTQYSTNYSERVVTIEIYDKDGQPVDTLVSEAFSDTGDAYCNFWARSTEGYLFVGRIEGVNGNEWLALNCHLTGVKAPAWYEGTNIFAHIRK